MPVTTENGFRQLDHAFRENLETLPRRHTIFNRGTDATTIYVIQNGSVDVISDEGKKGLGKGKVFGGEAGYQNHYDSKATTTRVTIVGSMDQGPFQQLLGRYPEAALAWPGFMEGKRPSASETVRVLPSLTDTDLTVLQLSASGFSVEELAGQYSDTHSESYMRNYTHELHTKFGESSLSQAVFIAYKMGLVNDKAVSDTELSLIHTLSPQQRRILQVFTETNGELSGSRQINKKIGEKLGLAEKTIGTQFGLMKQKLHTKNRIHTGMMYLVAKKAGLLEEKYYDTN